MAFTEIKDFFELIAYIVTIFGFPIAIYIFYLERERERAEIKAQALTQSSDRYVEFLTLSLNYPRLDVFSVPILDKYELTAEEVRIESSLISMLIDMFEKAYLMYHLEQKCIHESQWNGWIGTIKSYCFRDNFTREWEIVGTQFDVSFYSFMQDLINEKSLKESNNA
tara:strand:+ start:1625 stop:2125 length:501 start_codon:yes stop_codon:yes gene_type:complete